MEGLTEGSMVHYVLTGGRSEGQHRPAIVVRDWVHAAPSDRDGVVNLQVFTDAVNDYRVGEVGSTGLMWATSVQYSEAKEPGTWHWIEKA